MVFDLKQFLANLFEVSGDDDEVTVAEPNQNVTVTEPIVRDDASIPRIQYKRSDTKSSDGILHECTFIISATMTTEESAIQLIDNKLL